MVSPVYDLREIEMNIAEMIVTNMSVEYLNFKLKKFNRTRKKFVRFNLNGQSLWYTRADAVKLIKEALRRAKISQ